MKYLLIVAAIVLLVVLITAIIGYLLPVNHTAKGEILLNATPEKVWQRLTDVKDYPNWRKKLKSVELVADKSWTEIDQRGHQLPFIIIKETPFNQLVTKINGINIPFGGTWTFTLQKKENKTLLIITEDGEVYNPIFRFVSKYIMGYNTTIDQYLKDLDAAFQ